MYTVTVVVQTLWWLVVKVTRLVLCVWLWTKTLKVQCEQHRQCRTMRLLNYFLRGRSLAHFPRWVRPVLRSRPPFFHPLWED